MILDSLRYWVEDDACGRIPVRSRLDPGARSHRASVLPNPPVLWDIESDPVLAGTKMIAEAWDAAGLYQVGSFVGDSWKEWNGRFRDDVRDFFRGDRGLGRDASPTGLLGSPDIYGHEEREAEQSVNFVTCHDGFTLNDLVSYNRKHNEDNGEGNHDGARRQPELELRRGGADGRSGDRVAARTAGQELPDRHDALAGHTHDPDGRRGAAHAARQQQRLLPGQRDQLVRLDAAGAARRRAPVRHAAHCSGGSCGTWTTSVAG